MRLWNPVANNLFDLSNGYVLSLLNHPTSTPNSFRMDHSELVSRIVDEIKNEGAEFNLDDPFDDPSLVTMAFMDIAWQDEHGNSALMLAAAENRVLQVKGILTMAINGGKLWQVIDMRNNEGLNCVEMAVRAGSETCAMLITKVAREYAKLRPRLPNDKKYETMTTEEEVTSSLGQKAVEHLDESYVKELVRQSSSASGHGLSMKRLSREKISNSLVSNRGNSASTAGHEYLKMVKRSRSAHSRLMSQRTFSVESESVDSSEPTTPQLTLPPQDHGVFSSVGERIRSIFSRKPPTERAAPPPARFVPVSTKSSAYQSTSVSYEENHIRLPQHSASEPSSSSPPVESPSTSSGGIFRGSMWSSKEKPISTITTPNGVRLPPLSLRRRASNDHRNQNFSSLGDDDK
ncbi:unnamed protein product [Caenorhabditis sp. 36 PRJEB53466]|nr:unnamed protein product [Caenorhabditis sp. 36 PRJEB53466]